MPVYEQLLACLKAENPQSGVREFVRVLKLHQEYPAEWVEQAIAQALQFGCIHVDGVKLCLHQIQNPSVPVPPLQPTGTQAHLFQVGSQPLDLHRYEQLLSERVAP